MVADKAEREGERNKGKSPKNAGVGSVYAKIWGSENDFPKNKKEEEE